MRGSAAGLALPARRVVGADESLGELSGLAAERALEMAGWQADSLDLIVLATFNPRRSFRFRTASASPHWGRQCRGL
jgi:3-oxoacyl-[acyl-carrier-protein] synthase III